jgi:probable phosphoglycerate mutase
VPRINWPDRMWLVRHGESEGNIANDLARRNNSFRLELNVNDVDIPLSSVGVDQALALGRWFGDLPAGQQPDAVIVSPYMRAQQTAELILAAAGLAHIPHSIDERLRDREQGVLDRLTSSGFRDQYPDEAARRDYLGKFWYRPYGGESWADAALRVRAALLEVQLTRCGQRLLVVGHDMTIIIIRYVLEQLSADGAVGLSGIIRNCSTTTYDLVGDSMTLRSFNDITAIERDGDALTTTHD